MEAAAVRLYFLLEHNYSLVTMSCILHTIWVNSCTRNKINFSKDNIARGLCTLVPFIHNASISQTICKCYRVPVEHMQKSGTANCNIMLKYYYTETQVLSRDSKPQSHRTTAVRPLLLTARAYYHTVRLWKRVLLT